MVQSSVLSMSARSVGQVLVYRHAFKNLWEKGNQCHIPVPPAQGSQVPAHAHLEVIPASRAWEKMGTAQAGTTNAAP